MAKATVRSKAEVLLLLIHCLLLLSLLVGALCLVFVLLNITLCPSGFAMSLCASVHMCFVITCKERADLLALVRSV